MLPNNVMFEVTYGSVCHMTETPESDVDIRSIFTISETFPNRTYNLYRGNKQYLYVDLMTFIKRLLQGVPWELEAFYAPAHCWRKELPEVLSSLRDSNAFISQNCRTMYLCHADRKIGQLSLPGAKPKFGYHAVRVLLDLRHMLKNAVGPRVVVNEDREWLMNVKLGKVETNEVVARYRDLKEEVRQMPTLLPLTPDAAAIDQSLATLVGYSPLAHFNSAQSTLSACIT